jgi:hypothetical protein
MNYVDVKYIGILSIRLSQFKKKTPSLYNFRCPVCGDSEKNRHKARGYLYPSEDSQGFIYKCHNCGDTRSLGNLIKFVDHSLYQKYLLEGYGNKDQRFVVKKKPTMKFEQPEFASSNPFLMIGAIKLSECDADHPAIQFAEGRKIPSSFFDELYYIDDEEKMEQLSDKYKNRIAGHSSRVMIPYYNTDDDLIGVTARAIDSKNSLRYLTLKFSEDEPMIYGLNRAKKLKKVYVVEGPIDSIFLPNGIAVSGSDFAKLDDKIKKDNCVLIFDNESRNREVVKQMKKMIAADYNICIWPDTTKEKDINDMILAGKTSGEIVKMINSNTFSGLKATATLNKWKRCDI